MVSFNDPRSSKSLQAFVISFFPTLHFKASQLAIDDFPVLGFISRTNLKMLKPVFGRMVKYYLISFHSPNSASSFSNFETLFKIMAQNYQNISYCIHYCDADLL